MNAVSRSFVRELIEFAPTEETRRMGFADNQLDGTVAIYNMLAMNRCAYLADEVGMGKTYIALAVMSLFRYFDPHARIVVIAPRENIQLKWVKELRNFVRLNWNITGNRVKSLQGGPAWEPVICNSLIDFAHEATVNQDRDFYLRMTSFSLALKQVESRRRQRKRLLQHVPWIGRHVLASRTPDGFRHGFGCALNAAVPDADLVVVDEAHNLKHGFSETGSTRNHIMGLAFGHEAGQAEGYPWYGPRAKNVLFLSATPFEEDYAAIRRQFSIFGFADAPLRSMNGEPTVRMGALADPDVPEVEKKELVRRVMIRRVSGLNINGKLHTKNMYRREWRNGGYGIHDDPMRIEDPKQRLVVALMQKKVAEILQDARFNNHFQIGMLSSFESFLESVGTVARRSMRDEQPEGHEEDGPPPVFDGDQARDHRERKGIDSNAIAHVSQSYRDRFDRSLPHPKLDSTAEALKGAFDTGEKTLVFVRRIATVDELTAKIDRYFDQWIRRRMDAALPNLVGEIGELFLRYERERRRRPEDQLEEIPLNGEDAELRDASELREFVDDDDEGSAETFFAWFFRGKGPSGVLSGAAFQKNRLGSTSSAYSTLFEDDHVSWLLGRPDDPLAEMAKRLGRPRDAVVEELRSLAWPLFRGRSRQKEGYPRLYVFEAYQAAALGMLESAADAELAKRARIVREQRHPGQFTTVTSEVPAGFPGPDDSIGAVTIVTELIKQSAVRHRIWPDEPMQDFKSGFRRREQRRELISAMARLGAAYVDLYLLAIETLGSFTLRQEAAAVQPERELARTYVELLERQMDTPGCHAFYELSHAADTFDLLLAVNFPEVPSANLRELAGIYGATLQRQVPVGRMSGGVNKRLVRQFRMPGFPLVLVTTDVLQEGEDLHTFCHRVVHYGITWTPSAIEQRTGRIDRIGGLVQRRLDGSTRAATAEELIQVFYPHLKDTVEVLQVRRILRRLNRFLQLVHKNRGKPEANDSRIDATRAFLEDLDEIEPITEPLESAFPVAAEALQGTLGPSDVVKPDLPSMFAHLDRLWGELLSRYRIDPIAAEGRLRRGSARIQNGRVLETGSSAGGTEQNFELELRSQAAGDATLLRCRSRIGELDLNDDQRLDEVYKLQRDLGMVKVCAQPDARGQQHLLSVEGGVLFTPGTTQYDEVSALVDRVVGAASVMRSALGLGGELAGSMTGDVS